MAAVCLQESDSVPKFSPVLKKICDIRTINDQNRDKLHLLLDQLSSFNYKKCYFDENELLCKTFLHLMALVPHTDSTLAAKTCQLVSRLHRNQSLRLPTPVAVNTALDWCLRVLAAAGELALLEVLAATEMILRGKAILAEPQLLSLLLADSGPSSVVAWLQPGQLASLRLLPSAEVELAALKVVKAVASPTEPGTGGGIPPARQRRLEACAAIFAKKLSCAASTSDIQFYKSATVSLKGLQAVLLQRPSALPLAQGLGLVRAFWLLGLPEQDPLSYPPTPALPGPPPPSAPATKGPRRGGRGAKHVKRVRSSLAKDEEGEVPRPRRGEDEDNGVWWVTALSDSEDASDGEGGREKTAAHSAVRFAALRLLLLLIKCGEQQALMTFWELLLPYSPPGAPPTPSPGLPCCLLRDPYLCSRSAAAQCVAELLHRCQPFLAMAEASSGGLLAFTPWSLSLAQALDSCQRCLTLALGSERVSQCLVTTLGAMASLASVTPYHRLPPGALSRLARCTRPQLFHRSLEVRAAALAVFGALASSAAATHQLGELQSLLGRPQPASLLGQQPLLKATDTEEGEEVVSLSDDDDEDQLMEQQTVGRTWLVEFCLGALQGAEASRRFRLEPCRVLGALARCSFCLLLGESSTVLVRTVAVLSYTTLHEADQNVQLTAGRALMEIAQALSNHLQTPGGLECLTAALEVWEGLLTSTVPHLAAAPPAPMRALACDLLATMGPTLYEHLPREQRLLLTFQLFALSRDAAVTVCTPAVRALGVCVNWPALMEDGQFVLDAAEYVSGALSSPDEALRSRAAWALGNLGEALVASKEKGFPETVPEPLLLGMLESALVACEDDKLKAYAVRALGNLLRLLSATQLHQSDCKALLSRAVTAMIECASSPKPSLMKVRWNACHSLACVMRGKELCEESNTWQGVVFPMLCDMVVGCANFKVRISAAVALAAPASRVHFCSHFLPAWGALLEALSSADNVSDLREFQHRDNLVDQICLSLGLLACLVEPDDLTGGLSGPLLQSVLAHEDQLRAQLRRVRLRVVPERTAPLSHAVEHLQGLASPAVREAALQLAEVLGSEDCGDPN